MVGSRPCGVVLVALLAAACAETTTTSESISRSDFGKAWPFTVKSGTLACEGAGAVTFEADGTVYAVNGIAAGQDFADIEPIWRDDPKSPGLKINIGPVIDRGLKLCEA